MNFKYKLILTVFLLSKICIGQDNIFVTQPYQLHDTSYAEWISHPEISGYEYGVYYFRKTFQLDESPSNFIINISADNRYKLYVNENYITTGPAASDLRNWNYEKINIAGHLVNGTNVISVKVWNWGNGRGPRQISARTAFIMAGETAIENLINSNSSWKVIEEKAYSPIVNSEESVRQGYIAGVSEQVDGNLLLWDWKKNSYDDSHWLTPVSIGKGAAQGLNTWFGLTPWILKERRIPLLEEREKLIPLLCYLKGADYDKDKYDGSLRLKIPKNSTVEILLDNRNLTMGYPILNISGGKKSRISINYQEALFKDDGTKGNRNIWEGKVLKGNKDIYIADGGNNKNYEPLWIRVFRYIKIEIKTFQDDLVINGFKNRFTAYPFEQHADFNSSNKKLDDIWDASWRTARLCALETYMDCPYYEQIQYVGDTRIQSLISSFIANDTRLFKNALEQFYSSMQPMGLIKSSHPTGGVQIIPPFALVYILMLHDYFMYDNNPEIIREFLPGVEFSLSWFIDKIDSNNMLGPLPYWNHVDGGAIGFEAGAPPGTSSGNSAHMSILLALALDKSIELFNYFNYKSNLDKYKNISESLKKSTLDLCFDEDKNLMAETPSKQIFSQHTNSMAIIAGLFNHTLSNDVGKKIISDPSLIQSTLYFDFYVFQALKLAGLGNKIIPMMDKWIAFLDAGLTTFPEHGIESRSDCHAWAAHPMFDFLNITCGIESSSPGFKSVIISPNPGNLKYFSGSMNHPKGRISIDYVANGNESNFIIKIPEGLKAEFYYNKKHEYLSVGENSLTLSDN